MKSFRLSLTILATLMTISLFGLAACSSDKKDEAPPPTTVNQSPGEWDYKKIRDAREAQGAETPVPVDDAQRKNEEAMCQIMTKAEMKRAKRSGCRPMDPRLGSGPDSYCCPKAE